MFAPGRAACRPCRLEFIVLDIEPPSITKEGQEVRTVRVADRTAAVKLCKPTIEPRTSATTLTWRILARAQVSHYAIRITTPLRILMLHYCQRAGTPSRS